MADVQLKLQASLDLAFLRNQLSTIGTQLSGQPLVIGIEFNKKNIENEYQRLNNYIGRKKFAITLNSNLEFEIKAADRLVQALGRVQQAARGAKAGLPIGTTGLKKTESQGGFSAGEIKTLFNAAIQGGLLDEKTLGKTRAQMVAGLGSIGKDAMAGLLNGLNGQNASIKGAAETIGTTLIATTKSVLGIASPSRVFKQLGEFSAEGLKQGFVQGLQEFKSEAAAEIRKIVALMRFELAKVQGLSGAGGPSIGSLRQQLVGSRAYTSPIGPLPHGSRQPWAANEGGGYDPRMVSRFRGESRPVDPNSFLAFSQGASLVSPHQGTQGSFLEFSQRASQVTQAARSGGIGGGGTGDGPGNFANRGGGFNGSFNMPTLPASGIVKELGDEFAFAAKQVLLYGAAYKALAFIQDFPSQVADAVGQLQSFRNTLKAISPTAQEVGASNEYIMNIVDRYNVPLESARSGFTKLYASMEPAGFKGDEIRNLFLGISKAAATFGMSSDKVDRVMYAFAQMASKGQIMSEELKGQLGDVLPGALGIFAKAAGYEGPQAIEKFSKALEDGAFKGESMRQLLKNVSFDLNKEFGPGAEGAARTYQGVMNRMQNSTKLFYESFEPLAVAFANDLIVPLSQGLRNIADGIKAYTTGSKPATEEAANFATMLRNMAPTLEGIRDNIGLVGTSLLETGKIIGFVTLQFSQLLGLPIVGQLAAGYTSVLLLSGAFRLLGGQAIIAAIASLVRLGTPLFAAISLTNSLSTSTLAYRLAVMQAAAATTQFGNTLNIVMARTVIGVALVAIGALIGKIVEVRTQMAAIGNDAKGMQEAARISAKFGDVPGTKEQLGNIKARANTFKQLKQQIEELGNTKTNNPMVLSDRSIINDSLQLSTALGNKLIELGLIERSQLTKNNSGYMVLEGTLRSIGGLIDSNIDSFEKAASKAGEYLREAERNKSKLANRQSVDLSSDKKKTNLESYYSLQDQLAKASTQAEIDNIERLYEHRANMIKAEFDLREAYANSFQKAAIRLQKELFQIEMEKQTTLLKAKNAVLSAQGSVAGGAKAQANAIGGSTGTGITQYYTGDPSQKAYYRPDHGTIEKYHDHIAFATKELAIAAYKKLTAADIKVTEFKGFGKGVTGPHSGPGSLHHLGLAMDVPGYQWGGSGRIGAKEYAGSARVRDVLGISKAAGSATGAGDARKVPGSERRDVLASQQVEIAQRRQNVTALQAEEIAYQKTELALANYIESIFSPEEQKLQNSLLAEKNRLEAQGLEGSDLDVATQKYEIQLRVNAGIDSANKLIAENNEAVKKGSITTEQANQRNKVQNDLIERLKKLLPEANKLIDENNRLKKQSIGNDVINGLKNEIKLLRAITEEEALRIKIRQQSPGISKEKEDKIYRLQEVKKNLEQARALIDGFVTSTSSDYKGFLKAVIEGEDITSALEKFQKGLSDRVLTIFLDFAMAPVEQFFQEAMKKIMLPKIPSVEADKTTQNIAVEDNTQATRDNTIAINGRTAAIGSGQPGGSQSPQPPPATEQAMGLSTFDIFKVGASINTPIMNYGEDVGKMGESFANASAQVTDLISVQNAYTSSIIDVQSVFGAATSSIDQQLENTAQTLAAEGEKADSNGSKFKESLGKAVGAVGVAAGAVLGIAAGIQQIQKGDTASVLGGIGSILLGIGGGIGGFTKLFGANGGIATNGWEPFPIVPFASGGMVAGPTLGLVGEGKYNEAIVPLPDGRSIPVQLQDSSIRDKMSNGMNGMAGMPMLSMSFQSTTINGVEYVDRAQLEAAMAETRKISVKEGATRGATIALDKLTNSPSSRRRVGLR